jgi:hypothetical protein
MDDGEYSSTDMKTSLTNSKNSSYKKVFLTVTSMNPADTDTYYCAKASW